MRFRRAKVTLRFPGQYFDKESGLNQNWNREYFTELGRYIQPDPLGVLHATGFLHAKQNGRKGFINLYSYADENPIRYTDRLGLIAGAIGGGLAGVITPPPPYMGIGGGGTAGAGASFGSGGTGFAANAGPSVGTGGEAGSVFGECWLLLGGAGCCDEE